MINTFCFILLFNIILFPSDFTQINDNHNNDSSSQEISWEGFFTKYQFKQIYIVFAGPYPSSPSSSFGHIFLLLEPQETKPFFLWHAIDFSANVDSVGSFEFFVKGFFGGLLGAYRIIPFYERFRDYNLLENRALWLFPLDFNNTEKNRFLYNIYTLQNKDYEYLFSNKNCASKIDLVLTESILDPTEKKPNNSLIFFPHSLLNNWKNRVGDLIYIESMKNVIEESYNDFSINNLNDSLNINNLSNTEAALLLNSLEWKYLQKAEHLQQEEKDILNKLRVIVSSSKTETITNFTKFEKDFYLHPSNLIGGGINFLSNSSPEYLVNYRFGLHEFYENTSVYPQNDYLSLLKIEIGIKKNKMILNELFLFNQLSLQPISKLSSYMSWRICFGVVRNLEYQSTPLSYGLYTGLGYTIELLKNRVKLSSLLSVSPVYLQSYGFSLIYGPELIVQINVLENIRLMNIIKGLFNFRENLNDVFYNETNLGIELFNRNYLIFQFKKSMYSSWYSIKYNFYIN